jgi:hypothetical protein
MRRTVLRDTFPTWALSLSSLLCTIISLAVLYPVEGPRRILPISLYLLLSSLFQVELLVLSNDPEIPAIAAPASAGLVLTFLLTVVSAAGSDIYSQPEQLPTRQTVFCIWLVGLCFVAGTLGLILTASNATEQQETATTTTMAAAEEGRVGEIALEETAQLDQSGEEASGAAAWFDKVKSSTFGLSSFPFPPFPFLSQLADCPSFIFSQYR